MAKQLYHGKHGYPVTVDIQVDHVQLHAFDAIIIPCGYTPDYLTPKRLRTEGCPRHDGEREIVAAICHAPWVLISAGVVQGPTMTCFSSIKDDLVNAGAQYHDVKVVRDDHIITSRQPSDLGAFCQEMIRILSSAAKQMNHRLPDRLRMRCVSQFGHSPIFIDFHNQQ